MTKVEKAIHFATKAHAGAVRKGTDRPYILHPLEAMAIVSRLTDDQDVIAAAVLHDTVEDTPVTIEDLEREFGPRVAALVASVSENKRDSLPAGATWSERKQETIDGLKLVARDTRLLCLGDKLSNLRDLYADHRKIGDELWTRFNQKDKRLHQWYYGEICRILKEDFRESWEMREFEEKLSFIFR